jgi:hypothetical protein
MCVRDNTPPERNYEWFTKFWGCVTPAWRPSNKTVVGGCLDKVRSSG